MRAIPILALALTCATTAGAQRAEPPLTVLSTPDRRLPIGFTKITGFYELRDGRVLVSDRGEERVVVADFTNGRATLIGRKGSGPGEYRLPSRIIAWTGDSLLLNDGGNTRLAVIGPDLRIHRSFSLNIPNVPTTLAPRGVDARGRMYLQVPLWAAGSFGKRGDSVPVVRITPSPSMERGSGGEVVEILTWVLLTADPGPVKYGLPYIPFTPQDGWAVTREGGVVLVRSNDYHVEWWNERGVAVKGPPIPTPRIPVIRADKVSYTRRFLEGSTIGGRGGANNAPSGESNMPADWLTDEQVNEMVKNNRFASVKAPITDAAPMLAPSGELWVERSMPHGAPSEWDVFNSAGVRVRRVRLPAERRLLSLGRGSAYVIAVDEEGFEKVERYRLLTP
jgi:hypothetical protein